MPDLTPVLTELLKRHNARPKLSPRQRLDTNDDFLKEAYRINAHISSLHQYLLSIRRPYLSTSPPPRRPAAANSPNATLTNSQRDLIDTETKSLLHTLAGSIQQLAAAESLRQDTERQLLARKRGGALRRWANGGSGGNGGKRPGEEEAEDGRLRTTGAWRESVVWYLGRGLEAAGELQRGMVEKRVEREVEKSRSVLYMSRGASGATSAIPREAGGEDFTAKGGMNGGFKGRNDYHSANVGGKSKGGNFLEEEDRREIERQLSPEQLQLFAQENQDMLKQYEDTLDQVRTTQSSLLEISSLQTTLAQNLDLQSARVQQLVADSLDTADYVGGGNRELKRAAERSSVARAVFWASVGLCVTLVAWDLIF
ncbi:hypothetical protein MMC07_007310 [Pseudocyphellaria aurata]|nr:hypothetical protein [Pseudocyphellaria aurata]